MARIDNFMNNTSPFGGMLEDIGQRQALWNSPMTDFLQNMSGHLEMIHQMSSAAQMVAQPAWADQMANALRGIGGFQFEWANQMASVAQMVAQPAWTNNLSDALSMLAESIDTADVAAFQEDIVSIDPQKPNWQVRLVNTIQKWMQKNIAFAFILIYLLTYVLPAILPTVIECAFANRDATLRATPSSAADAIIIVPENALVFISGDLPYWSEAVYFDAESETQVTGWISKRSIETITSPQSSAP